jgi:hypothetical protein
VADRLLANPVIEESAVTVTPAVAAAPAAAGPAAAGPAGSQS